MQRAAQINAAGRQPDRDSPPRPARPVPAPPGQHTRRLRPRARMPRPGYRPQPEQDPRCQPPPQPQHRK
jgi:hypothetical protein